MSDDPIWAGTVADRPASVVTVDPTPVRGVPITAARRRRRWPRRLAIVVGVVAIAAAMYYGVTLYQVWSTGRTDEAGPADAIVVMGAAQYDGRPSPQLQGRLDHALELYQQGLAPYVVVTGGNQPGDRFTEAEASARYLIDRGVPEDAILREDDGASTWESLAAVADILEPMDARDVVIVSDPFHLLRSKLIAEEVGLRARTSPVPNSPVRGAQNVGKQLKEAAGISLGRIIGFERLWGITG